MKQLKIRCQGATLIPLSQLEPLQGQLKSLSVENYNRLRKLISTHGFIDPVAVWVKDDRYYLLNGHQRVAVVQKMVEEGWYCPQLPVNLTEANTLSEAKQHILAMSAQYAKIENDGLYEFLQDIDLVDPLTLNEIYRFPDFSLQDFVDNFFVDQQANPADTLSNQQTYQSAAERLEAYLGSETRRLILLMDADHYDRAVQGLTSVSEKHGHKDFTAAFFTLLDCYERTQKNSKGAASPL